MNWSESKKGYETFLRIEKSLSPNSVSAYVNDINKLIMFVEDHYPNLTPETVKLAQLRKFVEWMTQKGISPRTQARTISGIKSFYKFLLIEEAVENAKKDIAIDIKKAGEEAMYEVGITGFDPKLVQIIGRLKYRTSYGQNALRHSVEVAHLSAMLAEQLGADVTLAKKGGLLHDIGKAVDHEVQGNHTEIGRDIARKFNLPPEIIAPIETHHDDKPATLISVIVKVADAISSARPGARSDNYENYIHRLEELEKIATSFEGIDKAYAIQAGREVRVFVQPEMITDLQAHELARDIAKKIETELKYPGEIKVNVIREMRVTEFAR